MNVMDIFVRPLGMSREVKLIIIGVTSLLLIMTLIGPDIGLNFINLDIKLFGLLAWRWVYSIVLFFIAMWAFFKGM